MVIDSLLTLIETITTSLINKMLIKVDVRSREVDERNNCVAQVFSKNQGDYK